MNNLIKLGLFAVLTTAACKNEGNAPTKEEAFLNKEMVSIYNKSAALALDKPSKAIAVYNESLDSLMKVHPDKFQFDGTLDYTEQRGNTVFKTEVSTIYTLDKDAKADQRLVIHSPAFKVR